MEKFKGPTKPAASEEFNFPAKMLVPSPFPELVALLVGLLPLVLAFVLFVEFPSLKLN